MLKNKFKLDNRGAGIVTVMVAVMFLAVLGSMLLMTSLTNFEMKTAERKGKQNFYDAETALSEIITGFQTVLSDSMDEALQLSLTSYGSKTEVESQKAFANEIEGKFRNTKVKQAKYENEADDKDEYYLSLIDATSISGKTPVTGSNTISGTYNPLALANLAENCRSEGKIIINAKTDKTNNDHANGKTVLVKGTEDDPLIQVSYSDSNPDPIVVFEYEIDENETGDARYYLDKVKFKNISVTYEKDDIQNTITTDIVLSVPEVGFTMSTNGSTSLTKYAFIAGGEVKDTGAHTVSVSGNAYMDSLTVSGDGKMTFGIVTSKAEDTIISTATENQVVVKNGITVSGSKTDSYRATFDSSSTLWAKEITVGNSGKIALEGSTYVYDDLELNGINAKAKLGGSYYGFGTGLVGSRSTPTSSSTSSSIIVNSIGASIDMTELTSLSLAGFSFVASNDNPINGYTKYVDADQKYSQTGKDTMLMGESFSIKGNQKAYLVDPGYISFSSGNIKSNPVTYDNLSTVKTGGTLSKEFRQTGTDKNGNAKTNTFHDYGAYLTQLTYSVGSQYISYYFIEFNDTYIEKTASNADGITKKVYRAVKEYNEDEDKEYIIKIIDSDDKIYTTTNFQEYVNGTTVININSDLELDYTSEENGNRYFKDYYSYHKTELNAEVQKYVSISGSVATYKGVGSWIRTYTSTNQVSGETTTEFEFMDYLSNTVATALINKAKSNKDKFDNLKKFLKPSGDDSFDKVFYIPNGETCEIIDYKNANEERKEKLNPFYYYVNTEKIWKEISKATNVSEPSVEFVKDGKVKAVISNGSYTYDGNGTGEDIHLIVCYNGTLTIAKDFTGIIFCSGDLIIDADANLYNNESQIIDCCAAEATVNGVVVHPEDYLNVRLSNVSDYGSEDEDDEDSKISRYVTCENWRKS